MDKEQKTWLKLQGINVDDVILVQAGTNRNINGVVLCTHWRECDEYCHITRVCAYNIRRDETYVFNDDGSESEYDGCAKFLEVLSCILKDPTLLINANSRIEKFAAKHDETPNSVRIFDDDAEKKINQIVSKVTKEY